MPPAEAERAREFLEAARICGRAGGSQRVISKRIDESFFQTQKPGDPENRVDVLGSALKRVLKRKVQDGFSTYTRADPE
jgi:hypothetical protein